MNSINMHLYLYPYACDYSVMNYFSGASTIFFSVTTEMTEYYYRNDTVKFHVTLANEHRGTGGWDADTNNFICPVSGFYQFIVTLFKANNSNGVYNHEAMLRMSEKGDDPD